MKTELLKRFPVLFSTRTERIHRVVCY